MTNEDSIAALGLSPEEAQELVDEFLAESRDQLADAEPTLLELETIARETGMLDDELVNKAFRAFHSLKGSAGVLGFSRLVKVTHTSESLLDHYRVTKLPPSPEHVSVLCRALDVSNAALDAIEADMSDGAIDESGRAICGELEALLTALRGAGPKRDGEATTAEATTAEADTDPEPKPEPSADLTTEAEGSAPEASQPQQQPQNPAQTDPAPAPAAEPSPAKAAQAPDVAAPGLSPAAAQAAVAAAQSSSPPAETPPPRPTPSRSTQARGNIRVDLAKLDMLQNLVGELIIAENMLTHSECLANIDADDENFQKARAQLNRVTRDLQDIAMSVRMVPVGATFQKMIRIVRDVSTRQGKTVVVELEGESTEIDKTVIEKLADPLVHIVRNSVDHGLESAEERRDSGKDLTSRVKLSARHRGGEVWVSVRDDGKGLARDKILDRARSRGLFTGDDSKLKDSEVWQFIFEPGFSTAAKLTDISGRGVGLDVVRRNVESLRGRIDISSVPGEGTEFTLRIPLTLAIIEGMLARVGDTRYTVPMLSVRESIAPTPEQICTLPSGAQMLRLRGDLVPILRLDEYHEHEGGARSALTDGIVVIVEDGPETLGIFVDELIGQYQTVIKPLPTLLGRPRGVSGMCLLANGDISLILDIKTLATGSVDRQIDEETKAETAA